MTKSDEFICCPANMFIKLFLISFLLQYSLGFDNFEGDHPAGDPAFLHFLEDGVWTILKKIPRGYMYPVPRVGRRQIHEEKRQNMIPQPRIGRELDINDQLAEIFYAIQTFLLNGDFEAPPQYVSSGRAVSGRKYPAIHDDVISNYVKNILEEKENGAFLNKDTTSRKDTDDSSRVTDGDATNLEQKFNDDRIIGISYFPKKDKGFDIYDGDKGQELIPLSHIGRNRLLAALEGKSLAGGLMAYPRLGRDVWELHQSLIPYPRAGRLIVEPGSLDYDIFLNTDTSNSALEDSLSDAFLSNKPVVQKRRNVKLIPRIGRKKRSAPDDGNQKGKEIGENIKGTPESDPNRHVWSSLDDLDNDYYFTMDKKNIRSKNAFVPRIGKKWSDYFNEYEEKRAAAFTPRIGRASLIPRIGRSDPRFRLKGRASFVPRIGRRAALIPRIGRSEDQRTVKDGTD